MIECQYILVVGVNFWTGGNDITVEGEWVFPGDGDNWIFYSNSTSDYFSNWDIGNVFLSFQSNMLMIQYPFCIYMNMIIGLIS